ncbi:MAG: tyrosine-type recombinase/integrase [Spirochaetes bacterium]|nr:tyrosine-type recombinase/integrase [Spirochaetota bacterium]
MTDEHKALLNKYLQEEKIRGRHPRGIKKIKYSIPLFFTFIEEGDYLLSEVNVSIAIDYQGYLVKKGYMKSTINSLMTCITTFFHYLKGQNHILSNPFLLIKKIQGDRKLPKNLLKEERMDRFLASLSCFNDEKDLKTLKKKYLLHIVSELMYSTGLRIAETSSLVLADIDFDSGTIMVREGKKGNNRMVFLNGYACSVLKIYIEDIRDLLINHDNRQNSHLLFLYSMERFEKVINQELKTASRQLGYPCMTSHYFRHTLGYHLLRSGCDIRFIQELLGHKKLKTTEIYTRVDKGDLKEVFDHYHPRTFKGVGL